MRARLDRIAELALRHQPCSVRHIYYQAVVAGVGGIHKDHAGYEKVQRAVLRLRRDGVIPYSAIVDNSRLAFQESTWGGVDDFLEDVVSLYRRDLWRDGPRVEIWCESDSIAGTLRAVAREWRVGLYPIRGQSSETFVWNATAMWRHEPERRVVVLYVGDHDPAGLEIEASLRERMEAMAEGVDVEFSRIGVTWAQAVEFDLPGTPPKKPYGYPRAVEAEALEPGYLRRIVTEAIEHHADAGRLSALLLAEASERQLLARMAGVAS